MYFSQRLKVIEEYRKWIEEIKEKKGISVKDCYETFLAFLETAGYRKDEEVRKETAKEIYERVDKWLDEIVPHTREETILICLIGWIKTKFGIEVGE